jgi:hypothetical protein
VIANADPPTLQLSRARGVGLWSHLVAGFRAQADREVNVDAGIDFGASVFVKRRLSGLACGPSWRRSSSRAKTVVSSSALTSEAPPAQRPHSPPPRPAHRSCDGRRGRARVPVRSQWCGRLTTVSPRAMSHCARCRPRPCAFSIATGVRGRRCPSGAAAGTLPGWRRSEATTPGRSLLGSPP